VNLRSVRAGDMSADDQVNRIIETLRMIGAVR
jgi:hypothetical protein